MIDEKNEAKDYLKLLAAPVPIDLVFKTGEMPDPNDAKSKVAMYETVPCFLHSLRDNEIIHCTALSGEMYHMRLAEGADKTTAISDAMLAFNVQRLIYAVRASAAKDSRRVFSRAQELLRLPQDRDGLDQFNKLTKLWDEYFEITEKELGNSLRARIATS